MKSPQVLGRMITLNPLPALLYSILIFYIGGVLHAQRTVDIALGQVPERSDYSSRIVAARSMGPDITVRDIPSLLKFLHLPPGGAKGMGEEELASLKNDVADSLLASDAFQYRILPAFQAILDDRAQGVIWREYVLQKYPELYAKPVGSQGHELIRSTLEHYAGVTEHVFAGTALLGFLHIYKQTEDPLWHRLALEYSREVLDSERMLWQNKASALQVLAGLEDPAVEAYARSYLKEDQPIMLQVSALAALGYLPGEENRRILETYARSPDFRLRRAAQAALRRESP